MSCKVVFRAFKSSLQADRALLCQANFRRPSLFQVIQMKFRSTRWAECGRKLRHLDYLSAMRHAINVPDNETVVIYSCSYCDGLHVGHQRWRKRDDKRPPHTTTSQPKLVHDLAWRLARTERRIALFEARFANITNPKKDKIRRHDQRLRDMRKYLGSLQTQRCNQQPAIEAVILQQR